LVGCVARLYASLACKLRYHDFVKMLRTALLTYASHYDPDPYRLVTCLITCLDQVSVAYPGFKSSDHNEIDLGSVMLHTVPVRDADKGNICVLHPSLFILVSKVACSDIYSRKIDPDLHSFRSSPCMTP
jgi:hypothetical protein